MSMFPPRANGGDNYDGIGSFLRLKDGESVTGILLGGVHSYFQSGFGATSQIVGPNEGGKLRYRHNFVIKDGTNYVAKIWEFGPKIYDQLSALENTGWDLKKTLLTVSRTGSTKENTKYTVTPHRQEPSEIALKAMNSIVPLELGQKPKVAPPQGTASNEEF